MQEFRQKNKNELIKVYKGREQIHYERFEDTIKYLTEEQLKKFLLHVKQTDDPNRQRNRLIFEMLVSTGMRINEFSLIKVADVNFDECFLNVPFENTKTKKRRTCRIKRELLLDLKDFLMSNNIKSGFIFRNKDNKPLSTRYYQKLCDKYSLTEFPFKPHPHTFRHTHIILALSKGVPMNAVQQQVGHIDLKTTSIYSKLAGIDLIKGYEVFQY